jgi:predicted RNA-binding protein YlxR (DUF448 family)
VAQPDELYRVVRGPTGEFDLGRDLPGRGAWLCIGSKGCAEAALRKGALGRALRAKFESSAGEQLVVILERCGYDPRREREP